MPRPSVNGSCIICGARLAEAEICGQCLLEERIFERGVFGFYFSDTVREAIHAFKFRGKKQIGRKLVRMVADRIVDLCSEADVIVPVPVTDRKLGERGYNQSYILALEASAILKRPLLYDLLLKRRETKDQAQLNREERKKNVRGAFALKDGKRIEGKTVLIVDDIYTTGYTAKEAGLTLLRANPKSLLLFSLARVE